jgi:hypothetical protein
MGEMRAGFPQRRVPQESPVSGERAPGGRAPRRRTGFPEHGANGAERGPGGAEEVASAVRPSAGPAGDRRERHADLPPGRYFDREESWLRFNQRVLELAEDDTVPLLERVRFLSIFASNLDEFFMVRVAGRMRRMAAGLPVESMTGAPPEEVLTRTLDKARELSARHAECYARSVLPALGGEGIEVLRWK